MPASNKACLMTMGLLALTACGRSGKTTRTDKDAGTTSADTSYRADLASSALLDAANTPDRGSSLVPDTPPEPDAAGSPDARIPAADAAINGNRDSKDATTDKIAQGLDAGKPSQCSGPVLLGGSLPIAESWGLNALLADMNGDGKLDVVSESNLALGKGDGLFSPKVDLGNPGAAFVNSPLLPAVGDLNGDGKLDLVVAHDDWRVYTRLGKGDGTFAAAKEFDTDVGPLTLLLLDVNGDKKLDVVTVNYYSATVVVHVGKGDGTFPSRTTYPTAGSPIAMAIGDVNGDTRLDIVTLNDVVSVTQDTRTMSVLLGTGNGEFADKQDYPVDIALVANYQLGPYNPATIELADVSGDGKLDVIVANSATSLVSVLPGKGDGSFGTKLDYETGTAPYQVAVVDLSQDGKLDIVTVNQGGNSVSVLAGKGDGTFAPHVDYSTTENPTSMALADLNGDGKLDVLTSSGGVLFGTGTGAFAASDKYPTGGLPVALTLGDLDGDGRVDLVTANNGDNTASVRLGKGDGTFAARQDYPTGADPFGVALGDLNRDGNLDVATANYGADTVSVLLGKDDGTFATKVDYPASAGPSAVALGDFNGDDKLDIATAGSKTIFNPGAVSLLLGKGDGTFAAKVDYATGINTQALALGDLNRDGKLDIVVVNTGDDVDSTFGVLLGEDDGTLAAQTTFPAGRGTTSVAIGDLNGDGRLDLVCASLGNGTSDAGASDRGAVGVLVGKGDGSFAGTVAYPAGSHPIGVVLADMNGDGKLDVVAANRDSPTISVLAGKGDGTLATKTDYAATASALAAGDLDRDGMSDLAFTNGNAVTVLMRKCQ